MTIRQFGILTFLGFLLMAPLLHAYRFHRDTSPFGFNGSLSVERFPDHQVQYPNDASTQGWEICSSNENGPGNCGFHGLDHVFIYQFQLGASDGGTITSFTLTVTGQSGGIFSKPPTYGILTCNPRDPNPPVPCSPFGAALTNCADSDNFAVNESGIGTSTYSQTWNFANCPAFVAGESLAIFVDLCTSANDDCVADGTPVIDPTNDPPVVTISVSRAAQFVPVAPCRVADTRNQPPGEFSAPALVPGVARDFPIPQSSCGIPPNATAYSLNVTVVPHGPLGYLTVWPTGGNQPVVSTLNSYDGRVKANAAIVPAGNQGAVTVYATSSTELILDIDGYFTAPVMDSTLAFYTVSPCRVADTRNPPGDLGGPYLPGRSKRDFPILDATSCNIPSSANVLAYSLNLTALPHGPLGYMTVWATGQTKPPLASTLNAPTGTATANAAIVQAGDSGKVSVYPTNDIDLVIDINGYFALAGNSGDDGLSMYPVVPCRVLDTRLAGGAFTGHLNPPVNVLGSSCGVPSTAQAYVLNSTAVPSGSLGFLTVWPDSWILSQPVASTLNAWDGVVTSNMAIVAAGYQSNIDAYAEEDTSPTNLLLDIFSYFAP